MNNSHSRVIPLADEETEQKPVKANFKSSVGLERAPGTDRNE